MSDPSTLTAFDLAFRPRLEDPEDQKVLAVVRAVLTQGRALVATTDRPALDLAQHVEEAKADVVVVIDSKSAGNAGYVFPRWVARQVRENRPGMRGDSFLDAVRALVSDPQLQWGRSHLHEWLNFQRPVVGWCEGKGDEGPHQVDDSIVPCRRHR